MGIPERLIWGPVIYAGGDGKIVAGLLRQYVAWVIGWIVCALIAPTFAFRAFVLITSLAISGGLAVKESAVALFCCGFIMYDIISITYVILLGFLIAGPCLLWGKNRADLFAPLDAP